MKRATVVICVLFVWLAVATPHNPLWGAQARSTANAAADVGTSPQAPPQFLQAADEVIAVMSKLVDLPIKEPLKKSLRSKEQIRAYVVQEDKEDKDEAQKYADEKSMEAFGLIPKGFPLESFMQDLLTDQIAGLYDPKGKEFYIADWIPVDEQREVMAHELTHALEDQSFHIDPWIKGARPNDDAELARDAVSEGSAMAAMVDYDLRSNKMSVRDLPDVSMLIQGNALAEMDKDPKLAKAPIYIRDSLLFPYLAGVSFTQQFLKAHSGWSDLHLVFEHPPASTQQIMHPEKYLEDVQPAVVKLPDWSTVAPSDWKLLDENVLGEFGLQEVLKQFLGADSAKLTAPGWAGDRYAVFEDEKAGTLPLVAVIDAEDEEHATRLFGQYSSALEIKYQSHSSISRRAHFFQFHTDGGDVFVKQSGTQCLIVEEASQEAFNKIDQAITWPFTPPPAGRPSQSPPPGVAQNATGASSAPAAMLAAIH